jgi:Polyketide cyclase / dehydrase and lipid transport
MILGERVGHEQRDEAVHHRRVRSDMLHIQGEIVINRPVEEVFDFVADERNEPRYNSQMRRAEQITRGPIGAGTRFRAEMVSMGRPVEMVIEFTAYQRPRRLLSSTHMSAMDTLGGLTFDPVPGGTRMRWSWGLRARGVLKLMGPMVVRMGRRQEQRIWTGLKHLLEEQKTPAVSS